MPGIIKIRPLVEGDKAFVFATWLRHLWYHRDNNTTLSKETFMRLHHARIEKAINTDCFEIAVLAEDPEVIVGYACHADKRFIYLKKAWRGLGIEKLFRGEPL